MKCKLRIRLAHPGQSDSVRGRWVVVQIINRGNPLYLKEVAAFGPGKNDNIIDQSCEISSSLHRSNLSKLVLHQEKHVIATNLILKLNEPEKDGYV